MGGSGLNGPNCPGCKGWGDPAALVPHCMHSLARAFLQAGMVPTCPAVPHATWSLLWVQPAGKSAQVLQAILLTPRGEPTFQGGFYDAVQ